MEDPNSMFVWWPLVKDLDVPMPNTILVPVDMEPVMQYFYAHEDGHGWEQYASGFRDCCCNVKEAADLIGYPCFLRSDEASAKFDWKDTCFLASPDDIPDHVLNIVEFTEMSFGLDINGFIVREILQPDAHFNAFRGKMPIGSERREFVDAGTSLCGHPYWHQAAIRNPTNENWKLWLQASNTITKEEEGLLIEYAVTLGEALSEIHARWSVDFMRDINGKWWFIDCAEAERSWHPYCEVAKSLGMPCEDLKDDGPDDPWG
jgi:hypothetical protein